MWRVRWAYLQHSAAAAHVAMACLLNFIVTLCTGCFPAAKLPSLARATLCRAVWILCTNTCARHRAAPCAPHQGSPHDADVAAGRSLWLLLLLPVAPAGRTHQGCGLNCVQLARKASLRRCAASSVALLMSRLGWIATSRW